jgi:transcriptional regulator GlxA family with amidase domain
LRVRLRRAQELLEETDLPLATIAERAGFLHSEYFSVAFKRVNQTTPSEYRRRLRAGK